MALLNLFMAILIILLVSKGVLGTTFTFVNKCDDTVWPGILASAGSPKLQSTGFELKKGSSRSFQAPTGWSGRFWGRTGCNFDSSGHGSCATGDCGSGQVECNNEGATPPATLAEFTLGGSGSKDYYDVSLVDGYNLPMLVEGTGGSGSCTTTGCVVDLNSRCPAELKANGGTACKSACDAFGSPEYCCSGQFNTPSACKPSTYSQIFKSACPRSYSYAYDDGSSTFTCSNADYTITFCPIPPSLKSSSDAPPRPAETLDDGAAPAGAGDNGAVPVGQSALASTSWLANMATGGSNRIYQPFVVQLGLVLGNFLVSLFFHLQFVVSHSP